MIEEATGQESGSVYQDRIMPRDNEGIVVKTHKLDRSEYTKTVHLVRDPFDAIESYYDWRIDIGGEVIEWKHHVQECVSQWASHTDHWTASSAPPHVTIRFEDMKSDAGEALDKALEWIGISPSNRSIQSAVEASKLSRVRKKSPIGDKFYRSGKTGEGVSQFSTAQRKMVFERLNVQMCKYGYAEIDL